MRNLFLTVAGLGLLCVVAGCTEGHLCGYCDCDPGNDRCCYYYGPGAPSPYHPLNTLSALPTKPAGELAPAPKAESPKEK